MTIKTKKQFVHLAAPESSVVTRRKFILSSGAALTLFIPGVSFALLSASPAGTFAIAGTAIAGMAIAGTTGGSGPGEGVFSF